MTYIVLYFSEEIKLKVNSLTSNIFINSIMDLKVFCSELQKIKSVNNNLQVKLGELTLSLNNSLIFESCSQDSVFTLIKTVQSFLCHHYYTDYLKSKNKGMHYTDNNEDSHLTNIQSSTYDNCMNLVLVISAKISKLQVKFAKYMVDSFVEHINNHNDCFNYIISFYRLYITSSTTKQACKEYELHNHLFDIYANIYKASSNFESSDFSGRMKDLNALQKVENRGSNTDKRYFLDDFRVKHREENSSKSII